MVHEAIRLLVDSYVKIYLSGGSVVKALVFALGIVELEILAQPDLGFLEILVRAEVDVFLFHAAPQPFCEDIVQASPTTVHANLDTSLFQQANVCLARKVTALVGITDVRYLCPAVASKP